MIDFKFHVISLVAVLIALAVGMLLGTTLVEKGLISQQKSQISSLEKTFAEIREKNRALNDELNAYKQFAEICEPILIGGRLAGGNFVVISGTDTDGGMSKSVHEVILASGGMIPLNVTVMGEEEFSNSAVITALSQIFGIAEDENVLKEKVFFELFSQLKTPSNPEILTSLEAAGVIKIKGAVSTPLSGAIILSEVEKNSVEKIDVPLIKASTEVGFPVVVVGGAKTDRKAMETYKKIGVSTVERVESSPGRIALIFCLSGEGGHYGVGSTADRVIPTPQNI
ncbi:MAG: copper transporter [Actinomycetota bacterium]|nr:copper transporter [Actinomycetota bacterium]